MGSLSVFVRFLSISILVVGLMMVLVAVVLLLLLLLLPTPIVAGDVGRRVGAVHGGRGPTSAHSDSDGCERLQHAASSKSLNYVSLQQRQKWIRLRIVSQVSL